ncbi:MAG: Rnase Y domain-containing protein, partial [Rikenellaceae bacterium]|nr:Rnase Y domain-containing protein [Rikenellaceae bacterium]
MIAIVIKALVAAAIAAFVTIVITNRTLRRRREQMIKEAESQGEMIKKEKILQAKERFIQLKAEHDKAVNERNNKLAQAEQRVKQLE